MHDSWDYIQSVNVRDVRGDMQARTDCHSITMPLSSLTTFEIVNSMTALLSSLNLGD